MSWKPGICPPYMKHMTRNQASVIFKARAKMIECKGNYKNKYKDKNLNCRFCEITEEKQNHILEERNKLHISEQTKITTDEISNEDLQELERTALKLQHILEQLGVQAPSPNQTRLPPWHQGEVHTERKNTQGQPWFDSQCWQEEMLVDSCYQALYDASWLEKLIF